MSFRLKILIVVPAVLLLCLAMGGCGETTEPERVETEEPEPAVPEPEKEPEEEPEPDVFAVGDTVSMGNLVITLNSVRWDEGTEWSEPEAGTRWLVADVTLENESNEATAISSLMMFDLVDEEHYSCDWAMWAETKGSVDGELGAGRTMRGEIAWETDEDGSVWELLFSPNILGFGQAIFNITLDDFGE